MQYIPQKASIIVKNTLLMRYVNMKPTFVGDLSWLDGSLCLIIALTIDADGLMLSIYLNTLDFFYFRDTYYLSSIVSPKLRHWQLQLQICCDQSVSKSHLRSFLLFSSILECFVNQDVTRY